MYFDGKWKEKGALRINKREANKEKKLKNVMPTRYSEVKGNGWKSQVTYHMIMLILVL